jgi:hypothetical protein
LVKTGLQEKTRFVKLENSLDKLMKAKALCNFVVLPIQALLLTGCVTAKVWQPHNFAGFHEPANPANVQLFYSSQHQDVLVEYDEKVGHKGATQRRAYWLEQNQAKEGKEDRPHFVSLKEAEDLQPIPVGASIEKAELFPGIGIFATTTNSFDFQLYGIGENQNNGFLTNVTILGDHELPAYYDSAGRRRKIMLTPPAVLADASIVAGIAAIIAAYGYAQSGGSWSPHCGH